MNQRFRGRPRQKRCICFWPKITSFKPAGVPMRLLEEVIITGDELEAIRLKDAEGLEQIDVAKKMKVSRPTVVRILQSARRKITSALTTGKALKLEKGADIILRKNICVCDRRRSRTFKNI